MASVYDFENYKDYLKKALATSGELRGGRSRLALHLGCHTGFVSQVLNGHVHFSLEHSVQINPFLAHDAGESHFFLLLVHLDRAGSKSLENYYRDQINSIRIRRQVVTERIGKTQELSDHDKMTYYSAWYYSAIHVMTAISKFKTKEDFARALTLSVYTVAGCLDFLVRVGLISNRKSGGWTPTAVRVHLPAGSPIISQHHSNWRIKALQSQEGRATDSLHFSGVWSFAEADIEKIREVFLEALERSEVILRESKDEVTFGFGMDFFSVTPEHSPQPTQRPKPTES